VHRDTSHGSGHRASVLELRDRRWKHVVNVTVLMISKVSNVTFITDIRDKHRYRL
jgi:hypothetical protein